MERLQAAIAKARAAREELSKATPANTQPAGSVTPDTVQQAWAALPEPALDPQRLAAARIVAHRTGPETAAYDLMRTNLLHQLRAQGWRRVAVTSPGSGAGKTTVCLNLAFSLARQPELRVMVLEMDLRRPSMTQKLGLGGGYRFSGVLEDSQTPESQLVRGGPNLAFGLTSVAVPRPAELLASASAAAAIDALEERYRPDVILFDMPPVLVSDDTLAFMSRVDCALMVAGAEECTVKEIDRCGSELAAHTRVLGVVLNKCRFMDAEEGYGYEA